MKRRTFSVLGFAAVAAGLGILAIRPLADGSAVDTDYAFVAAAFGVLAGYYQFYPNPLSKADEPAPDWWFRVTGIGLALAAVIGVVAYFVLGLL